MQYKPRAKQQRKKNGQHVAGNKTNTKMDDAPLAKSFPATPASFIAGHDRHMIFIYTFVVVVMIMPIRR